MLGRAAGDLLSAATIFGLALLGKKNNNNYANSFGRSNFNFSGGNQLSQTGFYGSWSTPYNTSATSVPNNTSVNVGTSATSTAPIVSASKNVTSSAAVPSQGKGESVSPETLIAAINGNDSGTVHSTNAQERQGVDSLKSGDSLRGKWADNDGETPKTPSASVDDFKNAVRLGKADDKDTEKKDGTGYPTYFTITDYRSHNQYTFQFSRLDAGKVLYKWNKEASDLKKDDADKYNNQNWEVNPNFDANTEFEVILEGNEIKLKYDGAAMAIDSQSNA